MNNKLLKVYVTDTTLSSIKKRGAESGKSTSEIARELIEFAITNRFEVGEGPVSEEHRAGPPRSEVMDAMKGGGAGIPPETLRYLVQDLARTENLLRQLSRLLSEGKTGDRARDFEEHMERVRMAKQKSVRILKNLKLDEIEDVDRIEITESTPEETAQMLKEMGIETGGKK